MHLLERAAKSTDEQSTHFGYWVSSKKHEAHQKIFLGRDGGGQQDFPVKSTRLTPETELGVSKEELSLGKSSQWDAFSQVENKQPLDRGIVSPSWTLALLPISCTNLVQPEKQPG